MSDDALPNTLVTECQLLLLEASHDHTMLDETVSGARIIKTGYDAHHTAIIDIQWQNENNKNTSNILVDTWSRPHRLLPANPQIESRVQGHLQLSK
jgi:hypothetical protein